MKVSLNDWMSMKSQPVAVLGGGVCGKGIMKLLESLQWTGELYDEKGRIFDEVASLRCSVVVFSPGFPLNHSWLEIARRSGKPTFSELDFASFFAQFSVVSITGTNGKTSLTAMLGHLWSSLNKPFILGGNIGLPLSQIVAKGIGEEVTVFLETSSFQAQSLKYLQIDCVLWTNFEEDHLDHHFSEEEYFLAKFNLLEKNRGKAWIGKSVESAIRKFGKKLTGKTSVVPRLSRTDIPFKSDHCLLSYPQRENLSLALAFSKHEGIVEEDFFHFLEDYGGRMHRLQKIAEFGDAIFWNDSKATNYSSVLAACESMVGSTIWIGGGRSKGIGLDAFVSSIIQKVSGIFLFGEVAEELKQRFNALGVESVCCSSMETAVVKAFESVSIPCNILFSPGFSSFDTHQSYAHRGKSFVEIVFDLKKSNKMRTQVLSI